MNLGAVVNDDGIRCGLSQIYSSKKLVNGLNIFDEKGHFICTYFKLLGKNISLIPDLQKNQRIAQSFVYVTQQFIFHKLYNTLMNGLCFIKIYNPENQLLNEIELVQCGINTIQVEINELQSQIDMLKRNQNDLQTKADGFQAKINRIQFGIDKLLGQRDDLQQQRDVFQEDMNILKKQEQDNLKNKMSAIKEINGIMKQLCNTLYAVMFSNLQQPNFFDAYDVLYRQLRNPAAQMCESIEVTDQGVIKGLWHNKTPISYTLSGIQTHAIEDSTDVDNQEKAQTTFDRGNRKYIKTRVFPATLSIGCMLETMHMNIDISIGLVYNLIIIERFIWLAYCANVTLQSMCVSRNDAFDTDTVDILDECNTCITNKVPCSSVNMEYTSIIMDRTLGL